MKITIARLKQIIRESLEMDYPPFPVGQLYHGTSSKMASNIKKNGFSLQSAGSKSGAPLPGISFSMNSDIADEHAEWAAEKFGGEPEVITINATNLKIAPGNLYFEKWNELGDSDSSILNIKDSGQWDGVALFDPETGDGIEEQEILLFNPPKV